MKITKAKLKQIIKEELSTLSEHGDWFDEENETRADKKFRDSQEAGGVPTYMQASREGDRTPDDVEVLVQGYGGLRIGQIRNELTKRIAEAHTVDWQTDPLRGLSNLLAGGIVEAFYKTLRAHNALMPEEEGELNV